MLQLNVAAIGIHSKVGEDRRCREAHLRKRWVHLHSVLLFDFDLFASAGDGSTRCAIGGRQMLREGRVVLREERVWVWHPEEVATRVAVLSAARTSLSHISCILNAAIGGSLGRNLCDISLLLARGDIEKNHDLDKQLLAWYFSMCSHF